MKISDLEHGPEEGSGEFRMLKNPLPGPPRRTHIRMEFDLTDEGEDDFDIEISGDDDFDI